MPRSACIFTGIKKVVLRQTHQDSIPTQRENQPQSARKNRKPPCMLPQPDRHVPPRRKKCNGKSLSSLGCERQNFEVSSFCRWQAVRPPPRPAGGAKITMAPKVGAAGRAVTHSVRSTFIGSVDAARAAGK